MEIEKNCVTPKSEKQRLSWFILISWFYPEKTLRPLLASEFQSLIRDSCKTEGKLSVTLLYLVSFIIKDSVKHAHCTKCAKKGVLANHFFHIQIDTRDLNFCLYLEKMNQRKARIWYILLKSFDYTQCSFLSYLEISLTDFF